MAEESNHRLYKMQLRTFYTYCHSRLPLAPPGHNNEQTQQFDLIDSPPHSKYKHKYCIAIHTLAKKNEFAHLALNVPHLPIYSADDTGRQGLSVKCPGESWPGAKCLSTSILSHNKGLFNWPPCNYVLYTIHLLVITMMKEVMVAKISPATPVVVLVHCRLGYLLSQVCCVISHWQTSIYSQFSMKAFNIVFISLGNGWQRSRQQQLSLLK